MEKLKQNKIWITIVIIGIIVIAILLAMLHQQKQNSPEAQSSSYASSVKASSASTSVQDQNNEKAYAKKAAKMKGHVYGKYFTTWTKKDFIDWANNFMSQPESKRHQMGLRENFGTSDYYENNETGVYVLEEIAEQIKKDGYVANYYATVKDYNKAFPADDPSDLKK